MPFISDDALISFRYARRLAEGRGLTWNDGYYVEGYSNLGWVLLIAAAAALKFDPVVASRCLGLAFTAAVLGVFAWRGRRLAAGASSVPAILALAASVHTLPIWAIGGLEQPLVLFCVFFGFFSVARWRDYAPEGARFLWCTSALFGVLALTRPDGILIAAAFGLSILFFRIPMAQRLAAVARLALVPACAIAGQGLFRLAYYGATVPNTARVKLGFSIDRLADGLDYVANGVLALSPLLLVIFLVAHRHGRGRDDILLTGSVALLAWIAYLVLIGGDIFPGYRHFTPVLAILFVMLLHTLSREPAFDPIGWTRRLRIPPVVFMMAVVAGFAGLQFAMPAHQRAKAERWEWDCRALADVLRDRYGGRDPVIAVTAAGCLPYWTGFPSIDLLGLNDLELPNRPPEDFGSGYLGHELGNLDYLLERKPDIVVFHVGDRPNFAYRRQIAADTRFERAYCPVTVDVRQIGTRLVYLRRDFAEEVAEDGACPAS